MTKEDFCKRCSRYAGCGFISRNLQTKCDILQTFEEGYEQGYKDAINKSCDWLEEKSCSGWIEDVEVKYFIEDFCKAMKGGEDE